MSARKPKAGRKGAPAEPVTPLKSGPPFDLTDAEVSEILASYRFKTAEDETDRCTTLLHEIADEVEAVAEGIMATINDRPHDGRQSSRWTAESLTAHARSLGDASARMMRYAGRLEAYRDAERKAFDAEGMVEAYRDGTLGKPKPDIEIGRAGRLLREAEASS